MSEHLLDVQNLRVSFDTYAGEVQAVRGVSFYIDKGETLAIVGESGCGKSVSIQTVMGLLPMPPARIKEGHIYYEGKDLTTLTDKQMESYRGKEFSMIFQDSMTSLNPTMRVGRQMVEAILVHQKISREEAREHAISLLGKVGLPEPEKVFKRYPHTMSGGQRQRVMIAMAMACNPKILFADEPTTALDVTIQAQILELMQDLQKRLGMAIIMVTHDLGVIADMCDKIVVMYGGSICERGTADDIFYDARHEYTKGLLRSIPNVNNSKERLIPISGTPINLLNMPKGCAFCSRCDKAMKICLEQKPQEVSISETHQAACWMNIKKMMEEQAGGANA